MNIISKFNLHGVNRKGSLFVIFTLALLFSALYVSTFMSNTEGQLVWKNVQYDTYFINYTGKDGYVFSNPRTYNEYSSFPIAISDPTRQDTFPLDYDYKFLGWTVTYADGTQEFNQKSYSIPAGTTGNIMLQANWAPKSLWQNIKENAIWLGIIAAYVFSSSLHL
jgi:uncharacterized repeat protein (TIGR02543 family)